MVVKTHYPIFDRLMLWKPNEAPKKAIVILRNSFEAALAEYQRRILWRKKQANQHVGVLGPEYFDASSAFKNDSTRCELTFQRWG